MKIMYYTLLTSLIFILAACSNTEHLPELIGIENIEYVIGEDIPDLSEGISAIDHIDGNLNSAIVIDSSLVNFNIPGNYEVFVSVTNSQGKTYNTSFFVLVLQEKTPPLLTGVKDLTFERNQSNRNPLEGVEAYDLVDGDITENIVFDDTLVNYNALGTYDAYIRVSDNAGNMTEIKISVTITGLTDLEIVQAEIQYLRDNPWLSPYRLNVSNKGTLHQTPITWNVSHELIMPTGITLALPYDSAPEEISYSGTFKLGEVTITEVFYVTLMPYQGVEIEDKRTLPFTNLTTEYEVEDGFLDLYFESNGEVPYVNVKDFLTLIKGFIDLTYEIIVTETETTQTLYYQYYDEDEDTLYDLEVVIDALNNTITTNDPGFYWAYVSSTQTNFGRHINYIDLPDADYQEGESIVYELYKYRMDIVSSEEGILIPFYVANQLFAGSSYYNVYYNYDGLYGIYSLPDFGTDEFTTIRTSSKNNSMIPDDLIIHNFDMLTFSLDYFYGLRMYLGIDSFYELTMKRAQTLLNPTARTFDTALRDLLLKDIDEPHTSYGYASYYNRATYEGPATNSLSVYGTRFNAWYMNGLVAVDDQIEAKWGREGITSSAWAAGSLSRPAFWFLDDEKTSVVVSLDSFRTSDIYESNTFDVSTIKDIIKLDNIDFLPSFNGGNKYFYFNNSTVEDNILEVLVKGMNQNFVETYRQQLLDAGFTHVKETSSDLTKFDGYYHMKVQDVDYMVQIGYSALYNLFYVSLNDRLPESYSDDWVVKKDILELIKSDSAVYLEEILENVLFQAPQLKNIMLDITWNTGGNVGALYRVVGFITGEPFKVSRISGDTNSKSTSYVQIDGVPKYDQYNWALLTSPLSFSAANALATIFKSNELGTVIGLKTGGGASSITPILLPVGSAFTMSSNSINAYRTGSGTEEDPYVYVDNELGITPDIVIAIDKLFDSETLLRAFE